MTTLTAKTIKAVRRAARSSFSPEELKTTRISMESQVRKAGTTVGPSHCRHTLRDDGILVFVDPFPRANFAHDCRYVFYDPRDPARVTETFAARFPPESAYVAGGLTVINKPKTPRVRRLQKRGVSPQVCSRIVSDNDDRFALLWSGMTSTWHMNDLEFCYRMLLQCYRFKPENIFVANFDGTFNTVEWVTATANRQDPWPGDDTQYELSKQGVIGFTGTRAGMQAAIARIREKLSQSGSPKESLLFLYTSSHGDGNGDTAFLTQYPDIEPYTGDELVSDLEPLQPHALLVTMTQCCSGKFSNALRSTRLASHLFFSAACGVKNLSRLTDDNLFGNFAFHWIAAQRGFDPKGNVTSGLITSRPHIVTADEAFKYAAVQIPVARDCPLFEAIGSGAAQISLG